MSQTFQDLLDTLTTEEKDYILRDLFTCLVTRRLTDTVVEGYSGASPIWESLRPVADAIGITLDGHLK